MPSINLISVQRAQKRATERKTGALFFGWVAETVLFLLLAGFFLWRTSSLDADLAEVNAQAQRLAPLQRQVAETQREIAAIKPKLSTLVEAQKGTERWQRILGHISVSTPPETWITGIRSDVPKDEKTAQQVTLTGFAADQKLVGEVMMRLNSCADLDKIELKYSQAKTLVDTAGVEFEIGSRVKAPEPPTKETAKGEGKDGQS